MPQPLQIARSSTSPLDAVRRRRSRCGLPGVFVLPHDAVSLCGKKGSQGNCPCPHPLFSLRPREHDDLAFSTVFAYSLLDSESIQPRACSNHCPVDHLMAILPAIDPTIISVIRDDLRLTTWILLGASLQALAVVFLPGNAILLPAAILLGARIIKVLLMLTGTIHDTSRDKVLQERLTARIPYESNSETGSQAKEELVLFIIGARSNQ